MICDICGKKGAEVRHVTRSYGKGANLLIIENVPVVVCPNCGESYLTAETLHEIERMRHPVRDVAESVIVNDEDPVAAGAFEAAIGAERFHRGGSQPLVVVEASGRFDHWRRGPAGIRARRHDENLLHLTDAAVENQFDPLAGIRRGSPLGPVLEHLV